MLGTCEIWAGCSYISDYHLNAAHFKCTYSILIIYSQWVRAFVFWRNNADLIGNCLERLSRRYRSLCHYPICVNRKFKTLLQFNLFSFFFFSFTQSIWKPEEIMKLKYFQLLALLLCVTTAAFAKEEVRAFRISTFYLKYKLNFY